VPNHNPGHSEQQRFEELMGTFATIRHHYPKAVIINLENSRVAPNLVVQIKAGCDYWKNYSSDKAITASRLSHNKGIPWAVKVLKFLSEEGRKISSSTRIHLICGRYILKARLLSNYSLPGAYFRYYREKKCISTRYFCYTGVNVEKIQRSIEKTLLPMFANVSVEEILHLDRALPAYLLEYIGLAGRVNGKVFIEE
jgi:hypothetical protein